MNLFGQSRRNSITDDLSSLVADLSDVVNRAVTATTPRRSSWSPFADNRSYYEQARDAVSSGADVAWREGGRHLSRGYDGAYGAARSHPALSALALVGFGVLIGMIARR